MLDEQRIEKLMDYVFTGFPQMKGKLGIRTIDPPLHLSIAATLKKDNIFHSEDDSRLPGGYFLDVFYKERDAYIAGGLEQDVCKYMDAEARGRVSDLLNSGIGLFSGMEVMHWVYGTLAMEPTCLNVSQYWGADGGHHRLHYDAYYITQWHGSIPLDEKLRKFSNGTIGTHNLPDMEGISDANVIDIFSRAKVGNFELIFDYFCVAHECMHAALKNQTIKDVKVDDEAACDLFGAMSTVAHFSEKAAVPVIRALNDMRRATQSADRLHATSPALSAYLSQDRFPALTSREAFSEAQRIVSENRPALRRASGQPAVKLVR